MNKKNKIYSILFLGLVLVLSGFIFVKINGISLEDVRDDFEIEMGDEKALVELDVKNKKIDSDDCKVLSNQEEKDLCFFSLAASLLKQDACNEIKSESLAKECLTRVAIEKAKTEKNILLCASIMDVENQRTCVSGLVSASAVEEKDCQGLESDLRDYCLDMFVFDKVFSENDLGACIQLSDAGAILECVSIFQITENEDCEQYSSETLLLCQEIIKYNTAVEKQDVSVCRDIKTQTLRRACPFAIKAISEVPTPTDDMVEMLDADQDGINNFSEINIYKTDPKNPDTDGDGYSDGDEIKNGYDPLK